jgi:hypothetical protein
MPAKLRIQEIDLLHFVEARPDERSRIWHRALEIALHAADRRQEGCNVAWMPGGARRRSRRGRDMKAEIASLPRKISGL